MKRHPILFGLGAILVLISFFVLPEGASMYLRGIGAGIIITLWLAE
jgi:hypothetical protein